jgi:hypothetical protein
MANKDFSVRNGIVVNTAFSANSSGVYFSNALLANSTTVNATSFTGSANNTTYVNGKTEGNLNVNSASYSTSAGSATNASAATNATYATSAGSATNASAATNATTANNSTYAFSKTEGNLNVNSASYATSAGSATNASAATNATYATSAGSATNASAATNATYATSAGSATNTSGGTIADAFGTIRPLIPGTAVSVSGISVNFTGIPSWVKRITVLFNGVSTNGTSPVMVQIGYSSGIVSSGYSGLIAMNTNKTNYSSGFIVNYVSAAAGSLYGSLDLYNITGNTWVSRSVILDASEPDSTQGAGSLALSGTLDRVRITTVGGSESFDAGTANIFYE